MSFCNPQTIDDFFEKAPDGLPAITEARYPTPTTAPEFSTLSTEQLAGLGKVLGAGGKPITQSDVKSFFSEAKKLGKELAYVSNYFQRFGLGAKAVESAFARLRDASGALNVGNFFRDFDKMRDAWGTMQDILAEGLGLDNQKWYQDFKHMQEQAKPFGDFIGKLGVLVRNSDNGGTDLTDEIITSLFADITNASAAIFGEDSGITKALAGLTDAVITTQATLRLVQDFSEAIEDNISGVIDIAESMMIAGLGMAAALCEFIPTFLAMCRSIIEMIAALLAALKALLQDPLSAIPKFNLNIDFSKLFKMPDLFAFRKLRDRWAKFTGTAFKMWKTVGAECSPDAWNSRLQGPGKISEAALSLSKATGYASQLATRTGDAPEGIAKNNKKFDLALGNAAADFINFTGKSKSLVKIQPARVNTTPATAGLLGFRNGGTVPASPDLPGLPFGFGNLNPTKATETHPNGLPVVPGVTQSIANHFDVMSDATAIARSAEVCASSTYECGKALKESVSKNATEQQKKDALKKVLAATRRQRFIQNGAANPKTGALSAAASDYYACEEKARDSRYSVTGLQGALDLMPKLFNQPAGLPGSIMEMAAKNNPDKFVTDKNNQTGNTDGHIVVAPASQATTAFDGTPPALSMEAQLADPTTSPIDDPNQILFSPANKTLDELILDMPLSAFPPTFHDAGHKTRLSGLFSASNSTVDLVPLYMVCRGDSEVKDLDLLFKIQEMLDSIDPELANSLFTKAFTQGLLDNNSFTWLAIGKRTVDLSGLKEMLINFLLHSRTDIRPSLSWLASAVEQNIENPSLPLELSEDERNLAEQSYRFLKDNHKDLSQIFVTLRLNSDEVTGPLGFEAVTMLAIDAISKDAENRTLDGEDLKSVFEVLAKMSEKLTNYPAFTKQLTALAKSKY